MVSGNLKPDMVIVIGVMGLGIGYLTNSNYSGSMPSESASKLAQGWSFDTWDCLWPLRIFQKGSNKIGYLLMLFQKNEMNLGMKYRVRDIYLDCVLRIKKKKKKELRNLKFRFEDEEEEEKSLFCLYNFTLV